MRKIITFLFTGVLLVGLWATFEACDDHNKPIPNEEPEPEPKPKPKPTPLTDSIFYVAGYHVNYVEVQDDGNAESGAYLFISENLKDTVCVYNFVQRENTSRGVGNLFDGIFDFPAAIVRPAELCGIFEIPSMRYAYKVKINSWRPQTEEELKKNASICNAMVPHSWIVPEYYPFIVVE